jgi:hypothetical protein
MFPKHAAGLREAEIPAVERALQLVTYPLLPAGAAANADDLYEWRCRCMELIDGQDRHGYEGVRALSRGRHTRASVPAGLRTRVVLPSEQKPGDARMQELYDSLHARWMAPGDKYDLPAKFDHDLIVFLSQLGAHSHAE